VVLVVHCRSVRWGRARVGPQELEEGICSGGAGALGFGVGNALFFALPLLFFFPLLIPASLGMGTLGGLMLGVALADWRRAVLLGLAGMVGFGVGGAIAADLGIYVEGMDIGPPPYRPVLYVLGLGMVGLIGGASLGAALGYLEYRKLAAQRRPRVQMNLRGTWERVGLRPWMLALLLLGFVLVLAGAVLIGAPLGGVCTDEERNVYAEFP
jgi:MFS family permease